MSTDGLTATLPRFESYGQYSNDNYGVHCMKIILPTITLWYSYDTIVAYCDQQDGLICRENDWSTTTGKHLNVIQPDHSKRIEGGKFNALLSVALSRHVV